MNEIHSGTDSDGGQDMDDGGSSPRCKYIIAAKYGSTRSAPSLDNDYNGPKLSTVWL